MVIINTFGFGGNFHCSDRVYPNIIAGKLLEDNFLKSKPPNIEDMTCSSTKAVGSDTNS